MQKKQIYLDCFSESSKQGYMYEERQLCNDSDCCLITNLFLVGLAKPHTDHEYKFSA